MNFFLKGDFKIGDSWENKPEKPTPRISNSRNKSREKEKVDALINAGRNIVQPSTDLLDDEMSKRILRQFAAEIPPPPSNKSEKKIPQNNYDPKKIPPKQKGNAGEADLLTSMAARLKTVEVTCKSQREEIKEKGQTIDKLKAQNQFLRGFKEDANKQYEKMQTLKQQNNDLKKKVEEMQAYLKKYGLKWVGNKLEGSLEHQKMKKDIKKPQYNYRLPSEIDIGTITRRVQELNGGLQSQGHGTQIYSQNGVHKFRKAEPLPMGFFGNGIAIKGYKFYPYKSKESLHILSDLVDGYFPYVLKAKYPNGVFLKVVDKIAEKYQTENDDQIISTFDSVQNKDFKPPSKEEFLAKLPKQIIKNGKVINIRGQIQKRLNGQKQEIKEEQEQETDDYETLDGVIVFKTKVHQKIKSNQISQEEICVLKIRTESGQVMILQLPKQSLIKEIYTWIKKINKTQFKLMSNYPRRSYETNEKQNLEQLGFFPNAMLHIQSSQSK